MQICPKCGSILIPSENKLVCECGYSKKGEMKITEKIAALNEGTGVFEKEEETLPSTKIECPKCGHEKAYWWTQQTRAADEPETSFFRCASCKHTWREYE